MARTKKHCWHWFVCFSISSSCRQQPELFKEVLNGISSILFEITLEDVQSKSTSSSSSTAYEFLRRCINTAENFVKRYKEANTKAASIFRVLETQSSKKLSQDDTSFFRTTASEHDDVENFENNIIQREANMKQWYDVDGNVKYKIVHQRGGFKNKKKVQFEPPQTYKELHSFNLQDYEILLQTIAMNLRTWKKLRKSKLSIRIYVFFRMFLRQLAALAQLNDLDVFNTVDEINRGTDHSHLIIYQTALELIDNFVTYVKILNLYAAKTKKRKTNVEDMAIDDEKKRAKAIRNLSQYEEGSEQHKKLSKKLNALDKNVAESDTEIVPDATAMRGPYIENTTLDDDDPDTIDVTFAYTTKQMQDELAALIKAYREREISADKFEADTKEMLFRLIMLGTHGIPLYYNIDTHAYIIVEIVMKMYLETIGDIGDDLLYDMADDWLYNNIEKTLKEDNAHIFKDDFKAKEPNRRVDANGERFRPRFEGVDIDEETINRFDDDYKEENQSDEEIQYADDYNADDDDHHDYSGEEEGDEEEGDEEEGDEEEEEEEEEQEEEEEEEEKGNSRHDPIVL